MANRTDPSARSVHGTNPQNLVEKILRTKIYETTYWKDQCFGLTAETIVDKAMELDHFGGTYGGNKRSTPFMCLTLKMLQIQPEKEIVVEFIKNEDYKYVRVLGAFYLRLVGRALDVYQYLEPLYNDYRKIRRKMADGKFSLCHVDEFVEELLTKDYSCDIALPRLPKRMTLESTGQLELRKSALEEDFEENEGEEEGGDGENGGEKWGKGGEESPPVEKEKERTREKEERSPSRNRDRRDRDRDRDRDWDHRDRRDLDRRDRDRDRDLYRERRGERGGDREREYSRYREREGRYRERSPERRKRYRSTSRSPPRRREDKESRGRDGENEGGKRGDEREKGEKKKKEKRGKVNSAEDPEIVEANKLRASLGLKPLRP